MIINANAYGSASVQLATPVITLSVHTITWTAVTNAEAYVIYRFDEYYKIISATRITIDDAGDYKIKAIASGFIDSQLSNMVTVVPVDITGQTWRLELDSTSKFGYEGYYPNLTFNGVATMESYSVNSSTLQMSFGSGYARISNNGSKPYFIWYTDEFQYRYGAYDYREWCGTTLLLKFNSGAVCTDSAFIYWLVHRGTLVS